MCFFSHHESKPVDLVCGLVVCTCSCVQTSVSDVICHADRQPAVGLITAGQPNAWPASGRGPGGGSGGSIIHLHPCLCIMAALCDRWPVYLWSPAATKPDAHTHTHSPIEPTSSHKGQETHGAPQETPRSQTLTHGSIIQAWLDVWHIHHLVQIHCGLSSELPECQIVCLYNSCFMHFFFLFGKILTKASTSTTLCTDYKRGSDKQTFLFQLNGIWLLLKHQTVRLCNSFLYAFLSLLQETQMQTMFWIAFFCYLTFLICQVWLELSAELLKCLV